MTVNFMCELGQIIVPSYLINFTPDIVAKTDFVDVTDIYNLLTLKDKTILEADTWHGC